MAEQKINHVREIVENGDAKFSKLLFDFQSMESHMGIKFKNNHYPGTTGIMEHYAALTAAGKLGALEFMKRNIAANYNAAMGTTLSHTDIPNSVFEV